MRLDFHSRLRPEVRVELVTSSGVIQLKLIRESRLTDEPDFEEVLVELDSHEAALIAQFIDTYSNQG